MNLLSIVVPCYNEEEVLEKFYQKVEEIVKNSNINTEFIFIDDC